MRALFTCQPGLGHFLPLTPIACALAEIGHDVAFGAPAAFRTTVEAHGFRWVASGVGRDDPEVAALWARHRGLRGFAQQQFIYEQIFGGVTARRAVPDRVGARPLVYVSLGTIWSVWGGREIFATILEGLRGIDAEVVLTVGRDLDPAALGSRAANVHVERFLPLGALLERCALVLFHGGSGTLGHVVAHGLPMVILPLGADQPENADRCAELGISRSLDPVELKPASIRGAVLDVLQTPSYRQNAEHLRAEFERLPRVDKVVELLDRLARDKAPVIAPR